MRPLLRTRLTVPGPPPHPLVGRTGNALELLLSPISTMGRLFAVYGPIAALVAGGGTRFYSPRPDCPGTAFVHGPELARQVTAQPEIFHHYPGSGRLYPLAERVPPRLAPLKHWGAGLFALNGDAHQQHRRLMLPVFHKQHVARYWQTVVGQTQHQLDQWTGVRRLDLHAQMVELSLRIATEALFGAPAAALAQPVGRAVQESLRMLVQPLTLLLPYDLPGLPYRRFLDLAARLDAALRQLVAHKRAEPAPAGDVLALLLRAQAEDGSRLSEDDLIGHMNLLFAAGHETTANALTWTCWLLSQHPAILAEVTAELDSRLHGAPPAAEQLDELPLLEQVIFESLRLLPPVPWLPRIAVQPVELGGYALPVGTEVIVSIYHTHHRADQFPEPDRFWPERWQHTQSNTFEYLAFGAGPHRCLGAGFALLELKLILAMLLQRFRLVYDARHPLHYAVSITLAPRGRVPMWVLPAGQPWPGSTGGVRGTIRELVQLPP